MQGGNSARTRIRRQMQPRNATGLAMVLPLAAAAFITLAIVPTASGQQQCQRIDLPGMFTARDAGTFNPAAFYHDDHGWFAFANNVPCHFTACGVGQTRPAGMHLGKGHGPDISMAKFTASLWEVDTTTFDWSWGCNYTTSKPDEHCTDLGSLAVHTEDFRPFLYNREVYISMTFQLVSKQHQGLHRPVVALAKPNWDTRQLELQNVFYRTIRKTHPSPKDLSWNWEKNWGWFQVDGRLYILYSAFPCLIVLEYNPKDKHFGYKFVEGSCFVKDNGEQLKAMMKQHLPSFDARLSGHPQLWGDSLYVMVHTLRKPNNADYSEAKYYEHFLLKVDMVLWRVTHISSRPIISSLNYTVSGPLPGAMVIGSFHPGMEIPSGRELIQVFMGEGDRYSCKETVFLEDIQWLELDKANWAKGQDANEFFEGREGLTEDGAGGLLGQGRPPDPYKRHN